MNRGQNLARTAEKRTVEKAPANSPITSGPLEFPEIDRSTDRQMLVAVQDVCVVVQFYPWFKFSFLLFLVMLMYDNNMIMSLKQKKRKFEPRIKLNHNICKLLSKDLLETMQPPASHPEVQWREWRS